MHSRMAGKDVGKLIRKMLVDKAIVDRIDVDSNFGIGLATSQFGHGTRVAKYFPPETKTLTITYTKKTIADFTEDKAPGPEEEGPET